MATFVIDRLLTELAFRADTADLNRVERRLQGYRQTLDKVAKGTAVLGGVLTAAGAGIGRTLSSYEGGLNRLRAGLRTATQAELDALEAQARAFGRTTGKSATEVLSAQIGLARTGMTVTEVMAALPAVLNLAIGAEMSLAEATGLVTAQLSSFNLDASESGRVVDVLTRAADSANTTVAKLGVGFRQVAPQAASLGIPIEEVAAALGTMQEALPAEAAGTALRNIFAQLQSKPSAEVEEGFRKLGLSHDDMRERLESGDLLGVLQQLQQAGLDSGTALQIFGREGQAGALLLANAAGDLGGYITALENAKRAAEDKRKVIESGLPGAIATFKSAIQDVQLELGDSGFTGVVTWAIEALTGLVRWLTKAPGWVKGFTVTVLAIGPALLGLGGALKFASWAFSVYLPLVRWARRANLLFRIQLQAAVIWGYLAAGATNALSFAQTMLSAATWRSVGASIAHRAVTVGQTVITWAAVAAQWALNVAMTANPIELIIVAIAALIAMLVAVGYAIWHFRDEIVNAIRAAINWVRENWPLLLAILTGPFGLAVFAIIKYRDQIMGVMQGLADFITGLWQSVVDTVRGLWEDLLDSIPNPGDLFGGGNGRLLGKAGGLIGFAEGGMVPGPRGAPMPAIVHGGEAVLSRAQLGNLFAALSMGPAALMPQVRPAPAVAGGGRSIVNLTVNVGDLHFHEVSDAHEIGQTIERTLRDQIQDLARDVDGVVLR